MNRFSVVVLLIAFLSLLMVSIHPGGAADLKKGETLFKQHCLMCHPNGGNVMNPQKSLRQKDLETNQVKTAADIVNLMRNPKSGMPKFEAAKISDGNAREIAEYILKTYK